jgi:hypothetical protein
VLSVIILSVIMLTVTVLSAIILSVNALSIIMLNVVCSWCNYADCDCIECHYIERRFAGCRGTATVVHKKRLNWKETSTLCNSMHQRIHKRTDEMKCGRAFLQHMKKSTQKPLANFEVKCNIIFRVKIYDCSK